MDNPYAVVGSPSYAAPLVNLFGQSNNQQNGQPKQGGHGFVDALHKFLNGPNGQQMLAPGSPIPGAAAPTSVGGANGPMPLVASGSSPMINSQGMGFY